MAVLSSRLGWLSSQLFYHGARLMCPGQQLENLIIAQPCQKPADKNPSLPWDMMLM